jgi:Protein of unknown function (DUF3293)
MEPRDFSPAYAQAIYKTKDVSFTLTEIPNDTLLFSNQPYAIITAHNPYSQQLTDLENQSRHKQLESLLASKGLSFSPSIGQSPDATWQEEGFLIFDITLEAALEIGLHFEQHAIIYGQGNRVALAWCKDGRLEWFYPYLL